MDQADVVIAGAGIVGLSVALELADRGLSVVVLERGRAMTESSWAAAGMLAANDPENPLQLAELARHSLALYPEYLARVERLSGRSVSLRTSATLQAARSGDAADSPHRGQTHRNLSPAELLALLPQLQTGGRDFLFLDEQSLDPRDLCAALPLAARAAGVDLRENSPILAVETEAARVLVQTPTTPIAARHFVNAAGAWAESPALTAQNAAQPTIGSPRIAPRKGQMTLVRLRGPETLPHVLRTPEIYLVPRGARRVVVGATVEHAGFDKTVEPRAIAALLQAAAELWPPIAHAEILESWAGLRPGSSDDLPLIGPANHPRCWLAAGHFRNGILLAPGTARALAQLLQGQNPGVDLSPFDPRRSRPLVRPVPLPSDNPATAAL